MGRKETQSSPRLRVTFGLCMPPPPPLCGTANRPPLLTIQSPRLYNRRQSHEKNKAHFPSVMTVLAVLTLALSALSSPRLSKPPAVLM